MKIKEILVQRNGCNAYHKCPKSVIHEGLLPGHQCKAAKTDHL